MTCAIVTCPKPRATFSAPCHPGLSLFCAEHLLDFETSPEGRNLRASSLSDFRDRIWKETAVTRIAAKIAQAEHDAKKVKS